MSRAFFITRCFDSDDCITKLHSFKFTLMWTCWQLTLTLLVDCCIDLCYAGISYLPFLAQLYFHFYIYHNKYGSCFIVFVFVPFLMIEDIYFQEWKRTRNPKTIWHLPQLLWRAEFKMLVMMLAAYASKYSAKVNLQRYIIETRILWLRFFFVSNWYINYDMQVTACKHEFHLQCILEWYVNLSWIKTRKML